MKPNPDDRSDNVEKIQDSIDNTVRNIRMANEILNNTDDPNTQVELQAKNERREQALYGMRHEIKDEADAMNNNYQS